MSQISRTIEALIQTLTETSEDQVSWLALADALEEADRPEEAALIRDDSVRPLIVDGVVYDADLRTYTYKEEGQHSETLDAVDMDEAVQMAEELCRDGSWGDNGASVSVLVTEEDASGEETDRRHLSVDIEPNHEALILRAGGDPTCDHDWTSEGEGGCDSNPGVWSMGGTSIQFASHCRICGLHRTEHYCGSQRNPGDHDTVEYHQPDSWCAECHRETCECD